MNRFWKGGAGLALLLAAVPVAAQPAAPPVPDRGSVTRQPDDSEMLQDAATVVTVNLLEHQGGLDVKLFGAASGDPAMNGLNTFIAFFEPPPENGWRIFEVGDFLSYTIVSQTRGRLLLDINESVMHQNGDIGDRTRRLAITWRPGPGDTAPATVTVAAVPRAAARRGHSQRGRGR